MRIQKYISVLYKIIFIVVCSYGLILTLGLDRGHFNPRLLVYYTVQSNLLCLVYFLARIINGTLLFRSWDSAQTSPVARIKGAVVMCITVTFLIYHFLLAPDSFSMGGLGGLSLDNAIVHYIVPIMVIVDWLLFDRKGLIGKYDPLLWLVIPYVYLIFALFWGRYGKPLSFLGSSYPYFFLNGPRIGWGKVALYVVGLTVFFTALGYIFLAADHYLAVIRTKIRTARPEETSAQSSGEEV